MLRWKTIFSLGMSIQTTILHVIIIINPRFKILSDDEYNTFAIYHTINTKDVLWKDSSKTLVPLS